MENSTKCSEKALTAVGWWLENTVQGDYSIIEQSWKDSFGNVVDFICKDNDNNCCVFIKVFSQEGFDEDFAEDDDKDRLRNFYEKVALSYIVKHPEIDSCTFRFDIVSINTPTGEETRCSIRHHVNALGVSDPIDKVNLVKRLQDEGRDPFDELVTLLSLYRADVVATALEKADRDWQVYNELQYRRDADLVQDWLTKEKDSEVDCLDDFVTDYQELIDKFLEEEIDTNLGAVISTYKFDKKDNVYHTR